MSDGMMEDVKPINGRKFLVSVVGGLVLFTIVSLIVTLAVGRFFGNVMNKQALQHEREIDAQKMRDKEAAHNH